MMTFLYLSTRNQQALWAVTKNNQPDSLTAIGSCEINNKSDWEIFTLVSEEHKVMYTPSPKLVRFVHTNESE